MNRTRTITAGILLFACLVFTGPQQVVAEVVTVYRDTWGVPHVYAETEAGAAYGLGYAQAEDRLVQLLRNIREAEGTMAEAFGPDWVKHDYERRIEQHRKVCRAEYDKVAPEIRRYLEAFQEGVKQYMREHPERVPDWAPELHPSQVISIARYVVFQWPMGAAMAELNRRKEVKLPFSSNQWAVMPGRTAEGAAMLCIDPHIPWDGIFRFYEMRAHGGAIHFSGFGPTGTPLIGLGHNRRLGWAFTTGGPDTTDIYAEQINPKNPKQYRYDGKWWDIRTETEAIRVRQPDGSFETIEREIEYTHHGPIALREGNVAYAIACPYFDQVDLPEQMYRMAAAENLEQFNAALAMNQMMEQNCMYADDRGNIQYVRTGRVPIRPKGYNWGAPVPGNTARTDWKGIHPQTDLVRLLNPVSGYMQNCNISPDTMMRDCPIDAERYPEYIFGDRPGRTNSRGRRATALLDADDDLTTREAIAIVNDKYADAAQAWRTIILAAVAEEADTSSEAVEAIREWSGFMNRDSAGATLFRAFQKQMDDMGVEISRETIFAGEITPLQEAGIRRAFEAAQIYLKDNYGRFDIPWGEIQRVARGDRSAPSGGGDSGAGMTLRAISTEPEDGKLIGRAGQSCTQLVVFRKSGAMSWSVTPWGQSDDPQSPHYFDQAERLFSQSSMKPTWFDRESLLAGRVESKKTLRFEP